MTSAANDTRRDFVVVANRLPVDAQVGDDGRVDWVRAPGGLVSALEPVMRGADAAWVGWPGGADLDLEPFDADGVRIVPVPLSADDVEQYYEGFSNDTVWPLYHDVISVPAFHREWWDRYVTINRRFAEAAAAVASESATVWVHDYQLQLVPGMLRTLRPDLAIGFFMHIPFPPYGLFAQLPWRSRIVAGLLGADVVGFQRVGDAANFASAVRRLTQAPVRPSHNGSDVDVADQSGRRRQVAIRPFPISIDAASFEALARSEAVEARAREIRASFGEHRKILLGVDRLDYTKGILHRLKAYGELLDDGVVAVDDAALIQIASPTRERVAAYAQLRDEVELQVGRINGGHQTLEHRAVSYHYHGYPRDEMAAMYLAADVMLVTALRDGMNLVAKEYVASRFDEDGVLVLSEFAGAADELKRAVRVNPHDIDGLKQAIVDALRMPREERRERMRSMRRRVAEHDVGKWSHDFLDELARVTGRGVVGVAPRTHQAPPEPRVVDVAADPTYAVIPEPLTGALREFAMRSRVLVALDFDGTLAPEVDDPADARSLPQSVEAVRRLARAPRTRVALVSGRSLASLQQVARGFPDDILLIGSHGAEIRLDAGVEEPALDAVERVGMELLQNILEDVADRHEGIWVERKPMGFALHTRLSSEEDSRNARLGALRAVGDADVEGVRITDGRTTLEFSVRRTSKGEALEHLRQLTEADAVFFAGDDTTDEDAFDALRPDDVGVKAGPGSTLAAFRVPGPAEIAAVLQRLADFRDGDVHEQ